MLTLLLGLASFTFGPQYIIIPIVSLLLGFITYRPLHHPLKNDVYNKIKLTIVNYWLS